MPLKYKGTKVRRLYFKDENNNIIEVNHMLDGSDKSIHKRVNINFYPNEPETVDTEPLYTLKRTWGVENIEDVTNPVPQGEYYFIGWSEDSEDSNAINLNETLTPYEDLDLYGIWAELKNITAFIEGELGLSGSIDYEAMALHFKEVDLSDNMTLEGSIDYEARPLHFKDTIITSELKLEGSVDYEARQLHFKEIESLNGELELDGVIDYEARPLHFKEIDGLTGELELDGSIYYTADPTYGITESLTGELGLEGNVDYEARTLHFKEIESLTGELELGGSIDYEARPLKFKVVESLVGELGLEGSVDYAVIKNNPPKTAAPTIVSGICVDKFDGSGSNKYLRVEVYNNELSPVTMYVNGSNIGTVASNSSIIVDILDNTLPKSVIVSAYAKATDKTNSNTVSETFKIMVCVADI